MKNKQSSSSSKVAMFVDCKQVGHTKFYKDGKVNKIPNFSKKWKADVKGTC